MISREATKSRINITLTLSGAVLILFLVLLSSCQIPQRGFDTKGEWKSPLPELRTVDAVGEQKTIVILVEFPDIRNSFSRSDVNRRVFVELNDYVKEVSYNKTWVTGDTTKKWYVLPKKFKEYQLDNAEKLWFSGDMLTYLRPIVDLVSDAINLAGSDVDFTKYRRTLVVVGIAPPRQWYAFGGGGACGPIVGLEFRTASGQSVKGSCFLAAGAHLGMFTYEFIQQVAGYEGGAYFTRSQSSNLSRYRRVAGDLFDAKAYSTRGDWHGITQYYPKYIGPWDLMGFHTVDPNRPPAGLSSFTKLRLGWIAESQLATVKPGDLLAIKLNPLEMPTSGIQVVKIPLTANTYYLIENRQKAGYDSVLPSSGVLIYYVDETIQVGQGILKVVDANSNIPEFKGAPFDIGSGQNDTFIDRENGWILRLIEKQEGSYTVEIDATKLGIGIKP